MSHLGTGMGGNTFFHGCVLILVVMDVALGLLEKVKRGDIEWS